MLQYRRDLTGPVGPNGGFTNRPSADVGAYLLVGNLPPMTFEHFCDRCHESFEGSTYMKVEQHNEAGMPIIFLEFCKPCTADVKMALRVMVPRFDR